MPVVANGTPLSVRMAPRQSVLAKEAIEDGPDALALGGEQALAAEQVARVLIRHRQRVAIHAVAGPEVALEVRRPQVIRLERRRGHDARVGVVPATAPLLDQPPARQEVTGRAGGRQIQRRAADASASAGSSSGPQLGCCRRAAQIASATSAAIRCGQWCGARLRSRSPSRPPRLVARHPLVAGLPADSVPLAQLDHRVQVPLPVRDEPHALFHGCRLRPRHAHLPVSSLCGVTHVPGQMCYLCTRFVPTVI